MDWLNCRRAAPCGLATDAQGLRLPTDSGRATGRHLPRRHRGSERALVRCVRLCLSRRNNLMGQQRPIILKGPPGPWSDRHTCSLQFTAQQVVRKVRKAVRVDPLVADAPRGRLAPPCLPAPAAGQTPRMLRLLANLTRRSAFREQHTEPSSFRSRHDSPTSGGNPGCLAVRPGGLARALRPGRSGRRRRSSVWRAERPAGRSRR